MKFTLRSIGAVIAAAMAIIPAAANAIVLVTFQPILTQATPGSTINYNATFTNVGLGTQPTYTITNATYQAVVGNQVDFTGQFNGNPTYTIGNGVTTIDDFFSLTLSPNLKQGVYGGLVDVWGFTGNNIPSFANFQVANLPITVGAVGIGVTSTPEPSETVALALGAALVGGLIFLKRRSIAAR